MTVYLSDSFKVAIESTIQQNIEKLSKVVGCKVDNLIDVKLHTKSIDARNKKDINYLARYTFQLKVGKPQRASEYIEPINILNNVQKVAASSSVVIIGSGPAGLFCGLYLARVGLKPIIVERGSDLPNRIDDVERLFCQGKLNVESNIQFGLGGAGTFSDGKLTTGIKDSRVYTVFDTFRHFGASQDIMYSNNPHIGTDKLVDIVSNMRDEIVRLGGQFKFNCKMTKLLVKGNAVVGVEISCDGKVDTIVADSVVLSIGHSARDTYFMLNDIGVDMCKKTFSIGARIEHKRQLIDLNQFGKYASSCLLSGATYKLNVKCDSKNAVDGNQRVVYSFCMCPGGEVVLASSEVDTVVTNGMSNYNRDSMFSNSALLVNVYPSDLDEDVLSGIKLQQQLEKATFKAVGGYKIAAQNSLDFIADKPSCKLNFTPSCRCGVVNANVRQLLPTYIADSIAEALPKFDRYIDKFSSDGVVLGIETRSSSPVRLTRDEQTLQSTKYQALYPTGEGAGYAGGIVSSAVDGLKVAEQIVKLLN